METYSDIIDKLNGKRPVAGEQKIATFNFPLSECGIGDSCTYKITFVVKSLSTDSSTLEVINMEESQGGDTREEQLKKMKVIPSPSYGDKMPDTLELPLGATADAGSPANGAPVSTPTAPQASTPPQEKQVSVPPVNGAEQTPVKAEEVAEDYVWEGDADNLPKPLQNRAKGVLRYLTKQSQALAEEKKQAEEYKAVKSDPMYQQFLQYKKSNQLPQAPEQSQVQPDALYTRAELEEAQINPEKLGELIQRGADARFRQAEQQVGGIISELKAKQTFVDRKQELQDFSELHPDFWDLHDKGLMKPFIREIVDTGQGTLQDAYNKAKEVSEQFRQEALKASQVRVNEKKNAFTSPPTPSNEPEIIWANSKNEATKIAFDNAVLGKKVQVRIKK